MNFENRFSSSIYTYKSNSLNFELQQFKKNLLKQSFVFGNQYDVAGLAASVRDFMKLTAVLFIFTLLFFSNAFAALGDKKLEQSVFSQWVR